LNGTLNAFLPLYATDVVRLTAADAGWLFGAQTLTILMIRPIVGAASDRLGRRGLIAAGLISCSGAMAAISLTSTGSALFAAVLAYAMGAALTTAASAAYVTDIAPRARYGAAHGVFGTIYDIGDAGGPIVAGLLVGLWGYAATFQAIAAAAAIMAIVFYLSSCRPQR
jgi:MFS family permease